MTQETAGALLRDKRVKAGLSAEDISKGTYIRKTYIDAIEDSRYDILPDPVYARGLIRNHALYIGCDPADMIKRFDQEVAASAPPIQVGLNRRDVRRIRMGMKSGVQVVNGKTGGRRRRRSFGRAEWLIILFLVGSVTVFWIYMFWM